MNKNKGLGRGLSALISDSWVDLDDGEENQAKIEDIDVEKIRFNENQPRKEFDKDKLEELSKSIREHGLIQPIILRQVGQDDYEIVAGERRYRACKNLAKDTIPSIIIDVDERQSAKIALVENIQREDLNPVEEARAYKKLMEEFNMKQADLGQALGKSRSYISNSIRLLNLDPRVLDQLALGKISQGHCKVILGLKDGVEQVKLMDQVLESKLNVRQTEEALEEMTRTTKADEKSLDKEEDIEYKDSYIRDLEEQFMQVLGTRVQILPGQNKGKIEIEYYSEEDIDRIYDILNR